MESAWTQLTELVVKTGAAAAVAVATAYLPKIFKALERKLGGDLPDDWQRKALQLCNLAIDYAEEAARVKLRELPPTQWQERAAKKLEWAVTFFQAQAKGAAAKLSKDQVSSLIKSVLAERRYQEAKELDVVAWSRDVRAKMDEFHASLERLRPKD